MTLTDQLTDVRGTPRRKVLISGAGIAGPALAFWLNRYGYAVTVVEKAPTLRGGGYPIDVRGTALKSSGGWGSCRGCGTRTSTCGG
jgi:glycine/D-amino acid oxidase-like deaminating enzyme